MQAHPPHGRRDISGHLGRPQLAMILDDHIGGISAAADKKAHKKSGGQLLFRNFRTLNGSYKTVTLKKKCYWTVGHGLAYNSVTFCFECNGFVTTV